MPAGVLVALPFEGVGGVGQPGGQLGRPCRGAPVRANSSTTGVGTVRRWPPGVGMPSSPGGEVTGADSSGRRGPLGGSVSLGGVLDPGFVRDPRTPPRWHRRLGPRRLARLPEHSGRRPPGRRAFERPARHAAPAAISRNERSSARSSARSLERPRSPVGARADIAGGRCIRRRWGRGRLMPPAPGLGRWVRGVPPRPSSSSRGRDGALDVVRGWSSRRTGRPGRLSPALWSSSQRRGGRGRSEPAGRSAGRGGRSDLGRLGPVGRHGPGGPVVVPFAPSPAPGVVRRAERALAPRSAAAAPFRRPDGWAGPADPAGFRGRAGPVGAGPAALARPVSLIPVARTLIRSPLSVGRAPRRAGGVAVRWRSRSARLVALLRPGGSWASARLAEPARRAARRRPVAAPRRRTVRAEAEARPPAEAAGRHRAVGLGDRIPHCLPGLLRRRPSPPGPR